MKRVFFILGILFCFACTKTEAPSPPPSPTNPVVITPTVPAACPVVSISDINKKTSHFKKYNVPFFDYYLTTNSDYNKLFFARSFIDINKNTTPDLIVSSLYWPGYKKGELLLIVDNKVEKIIDSFQLHSRKVIVADFNGDKQDDAFFLDQGLDVNPYPGGTNNLVLLNGTSITNKSFPDIGIFHGGCAGDVDNDGDMDVFPLSNGRPEFLLINDGSANFTKKVLFGGIVLNEYFHCEFYDLNKDGNLDLIIGGHEWKSFPNKNSQIGGIFENYILWGDGKGNFSFSNSTKLPTLNLWGTITDFDFYDLDNDGSEEIIVSRTGGNDGSTMDNNGVKSNNFYSYFKIQILKKSGAQYIESKVLDYPSGWPSSEWLDWVDVYDIDSDCILDIMPDDQELNYTKNTQFQPTTDLKKFKNMYFKGDGKGGFSIGYKK
jgi:hypothetical protein